MTKANRSNKRCMRGGESVECEAATKAEGQLREESRECEADKDKEKKRTQSEEDARQRRRKEE